MRILIIIFINTFLVLTGMAHAHFLEKMSCKGAEISAEVNERALQASKRLEQWLNDQEANLIVIGRRGQNLTEFNIEFSHVAFAMKESNRSWSVWHLLNECPTKESGIYKESLKEFLVVAPDEYEVALVLLPQPLEMKIKKQLMNKDLRGAIYEPFYSSVAHPYQLNNQNSNGWVVEFFISALVGEVEDRQSAQRLLKDHNYQPDMISLNIRQTILSQLFVGNATLAGHKMEDVKSDRLYIHSGDSILNFISKFSRAERACPDHQYELLKPNVCVMSVAEME